MITNKSQYTLTRSGQTTKLTIITIVTLTLTPLTTTTTTAENTGAQKE